LIILTPQAQREKSAARLQCAARCLSFHRPPLPQRISAASAPANVAMRSGTISDTKPGFQELEIALNVSQGD
jgi:hypothetical protein